MKKALRDYLKSIALVIPIYTAFVVPYVLVVLKLLGKPLSDWFKTERWLYAVVALGLIIGQGFILELTTRFLDRGRKEKPGP